MDVEIGSHNPMQHTVPLSRRGRVTRSAAALSRKILPHIPSSLGRAIVDKFCAYLPDLLDRDPPIILETRFGAMLGCKSLHDLLLRRILLFGVWEPAVTGFIEARLRPGDVVIDVGANVGYYSLLASRLITRTGTVIAVEASPLIFQDLLTNLAMNAAPNVRALNLAASDASGIVQFYEGTRRNRGLGSTIRIDGLKRGAAVTAAPLHDLWTNEEIARARLIKIDVEGGELAILRDLLHVVTQFPETLEIVVEVWSNSSTIDILRSFEKHGFKIYAIPNGYEREFYVHPTFRLFGRAAGDLGAERADVLLSRCNVQQFAAE